MLRRFILRSVWVVRPVFLGAFVVTSVFACLVSSAGAATARKPFGFERFTLQTTVPREVKGTLGGFSVVNEPYTYTQAGGHPVALTFTAKLTSEVAAPKFKELEKAETTSFLRRTRRIL